MHEYTNNCYPTAFYESDVLSVTYYDNYDWLSSSQYAFSAMDALGSKKSTDIISLTTGTKSKVLGINGNIWLTSVIYYDEKYNAIQTINALYPSGKEIVSNKHNWGGEVIQTKVKQISDAGTHEYNKWFDYDNRGRLLSVRQRITGDQNGEIVLASYEYDEMGKVAAKTSHNGTDRAEYEYTILGGNIGMTSDAFSYKLGYDYDFSKAQLSIRHDDNLDHVMWTNHKGETKAYIFDYDHIGQMTSAKLWEQLGPSEWNSTNKFAEKDITYDKNGNIEVMWRTGYQGYDESPIEYNYNGNQLSYLCFGGPPTQEFRYDANGNMTYDGHTGVGIEYNVLNLPQRIFAGSNEIRYIYSASGEKLASDVGGSLTYYRSVMVYSKPSGGSEQLTQMLQPEGIVQYNAGSAGSSYTYKYFKTDHLGSTRAVLAAVPNGDGTYSMVLEQSTDYYPFGLAHELGDLSVNKYLFSGKEIQDANIGTLGLLGMYDFGSRYYNPYLGRWFNVDPALQMTNPYIYCGNSPMMYVDPDGEFWHIIIGAVIGGTFNIITNGDNIDNFWEGLASFGAGAGAGALTAINPLMGATIGGGVVNATNEIIKQTNDHVGVSDVEWGRVGLSAGIGAVVGGATLGVGKVLNLPGVSNKIMDGLNIENRIAAHLTKSTLDGTMTGAIGGVVVGVGNGIFTGDWNVGMSILKGTGYGAAGGLIGGAISEAGYQARLMFGDKAPSSSSIDAVSTTVDNGINNINDTDPVYGTYYLGEAVVTSTKHFDMVNIMVGQDSPWIPPAPYTLPGSSKLRQYLIQIQK